MRCPKCGAVYDRREFLRGETPSCYECRVNRAQVVLLLPFTGKPQVQLTRKTQKRRDVA